MPNPEFNKIIEEQFKQKGVPLPFNSSQLNPINDGASTPKIVDFHLEANFPHNPPSKVLLFSMGYDCIFTVADNPLLQGTTYSVKSGGAGQWADIPVGGKELYVQLTSANLASGTHDFLGIGISHVV